MNSKPSLDLLNVVARTSNDFATLKRILGMGSLARSRRGPIISDWTISKLKDGVIVCFSCENGE